MPGGDREPEGRAEQRRPTRVTATQLRERGWTGKMVRELLGEPDARPPNRNYPDRAPLRLYNLERVEEAERTDAFFELLDQSEARKDAVQKGKDAQRVRTLAEVEALDIQVPVLELEDLVVRSIERYNAWVYEQGEDRPGITLRSTGEDVMRVVVHYLRFTTPGYQELRAKLLHRTGAREARRRLNERMFQAIAEAYPDLEEECERQNRRPLRSEPNPDEEAWEDA